jgi:hypothetical protein
MSRDKQIEERRDISDIIYWSGYGFDRGTCNDISKQIQEQGYRKASEVAREIFEAVDTTIDLVCAMTGLDITIFGKYAELKKKYTEEGK